MRQPSPCTMNRGVPPTARNARTGELTPPGTMALARSKRAWETGASAGYGRPSARYEVVTADPILSAGSDNHVKRVVHVTRRRPERPDPAAAGGPIVAGGDRLDGWSDPNCRSRFSVA